MITPIDIINPANLSGYHYVGRANSGPNGHGQSRDYWRAEYQRRKAGGFRGPARPDPVAAAWDYCNWANGDPARLPASLKTAGHKGRRAKLDNSDEVQHALGVLRDHRAQKAGRQGYVYCITDGTALKIGYSVKPEARVTELQTGNPRTLRLLAQIKGTLETEAALHAKHISDNILQEWFRPTEALLSEFGIKEGLIA